MRPIDARRRALGVAMVAAFAPGPLLAAGGAHGVDDAAVETPGDCHVESWLSAERGGERLVNVSPACTLRALPSLEIGAAVQRSGDRDWLAGPSLKWTLRDGGRAPGERAGVALAGSALVDPGTGRLDSAALLAAVTLAPASRVTVNLNIGAGRARGDGTHLLYGMQVDMAAGKGIALMGEIFGRPDAPSGVQGGVRWTFDRGRADIDLIAGRPPGPDRGTAVTLGLTVRR